MSTAVDNLPKSVEVVTVPYWNSAAIGELARV